MSPADQRLTIAKCLKDRGCCKQWGEDRIGAVEWGSNFDRSYCGHCGREKQDHHEMRDYLNDLNTWNDIETAMGDLCIEYCNELRQIVTKGHPHDPLFPVKLVRAKASQKAEAFLKIKGLWK